MSELVIERQFQADPETVFSYVTQRKNLLKWWGPESMSCTGEDLDFTAPGPWSSVMINAEGSRYKVTGHVISVDPPRSVELSWGWHDEADQRGHESRVRFEVMPDGKGGTLFKLFHSGLADDESARNHHDGWSSSLVKLERMAS